MLIEKNTDFAAFIAFFWKSNIINLKPNCGCKIQF